MLHRCVSLDFNGACLGRLGKFSDYSLLTRNGQQHTLVISVRGTTLDLWESGMIFL
ncbi:hypothetical protein HYC85_029642 [Camellia sinensis]|uniref:Uncharacterized protein n=1 Tax=Camellia sinensis TaxID=4442 RepID=A0A7J7FZU9_CAMSI|nr:hypothetical protein HYC85_029642 [Camellia sinensis]